jgi:hypothetical protein
VSEPFDLRVVALDQVMPHEHAETRRVEKLVGRLQAEGCLGNPPIVAEVEDGFVLLDGANRIAALGELGFGVAIVQVAAPGRLRLDTWHHVVLDTTPAELYATLAAVDEAHLDEAAESPHVVCTLRLIDGRTYFAHTRPDVHPFVALSSLVESYLDANLVARTDESDLEAATRAYTGAAGVVVFPRLTTDVVFDSARDGYRMPAGITRFVVTGRVLELNAPLGPLRADRSLEDHNRWLAELVATRRSQGRIRHYPEAVFVLDD